ncbi:hypothetical protein [Victivallis lenta]|uniref:hypothetical protein n=2 Tax=Victivallis lenta TaxID=2606640 RepID=UPI0015ACF8EB|nr:hypothetical protein [Victivallis lenta]
MSGKSKLVWPVITLLLLGMTAAAGLLLVENPERDTGFWVTLVPIMLAEAMFGFSFADFGSRLKESFGLFRAGSGVVVVGYFIFTMIMIPVYGNGISTRTLLVVQIIGFGVTLIMQLLFGLAGRAAVEGVTGFAVTERNKTGFKLESAALLSELKTRFPRETELLRESGRLAEAARFAAESVKASAHIDDKICDGFLKLRAFAAEYPPERMLEEMRALRELFRQREELIKNLR